MLIAPRGFKMADGVIPKLLKENVTRHLCDMNGDPSNFVAFSSTLSFVRSINAFQNLADFRPKFCSATWYFLSVNTG